MMPYKINLVEDEISLNNILKSYLEREEYDVKCFFDGTSVLAEVDNHTDLWILDIGLPGTDGFELLQKIRQNNKDVPVIFISARDRDIDRVVGLEVGADDYLTKPFLPRELVIRVNRVLGRTTGKINTYITFNDYVMDADKRTLLLSGKKIDLTTKEFDILLLFAQNTGRAFSRQQLIVKIWGKNYYASERIVDDLVRRLRSRVKDLPLESIYGYGYRMVK